MRSTGGWGGGERWRRPLLAAVIASWCVLWIGGACADGAPVGPVDGINGPATQADEHGVQARAEAVLERSDGLEGVTVTVRDGVATLEGEVNDTALVREAAAAAERIEGVSAVVNEVRVTGDVRERLAGAAERIGDKAEVWLAYLPLVPVAVAVLILTGFVMWLVGRSGWLFARWAQNLFLQEVLRKLAQSVVLLAGVLIALELLDATALVGGVLGAAGVAGIAIGFALRDLAENYVSSVLLSVRRPFAHRDHIAVAGHEGLVTSLTTRATMLTTFDGNVVRIPNATVFKSAIVNYTQRPERRFTFTVGVGYDVDLTEARAVGVHMLRETEGVMAEPGPMAVIDELGASSITIRFYAWVDQGTHSFLRVRTVSMERVKREFDRLDIDMPEPIYIVKFDADRGRHASVTAADGQRRGAAGGRSSAQTPSGVDDRDRRVAMDVSKDTTAEDMADENRDAGDGRSLMDQENGLQARASAE